VYLFAANTKGYGGAGITASTNNASLSLLTSGTLDNNGGPTNGDYYVTTVAGGAFSISSDYTCSAGQQVYLYALGGTQGSATNSATGLLAALGTCPGTAGTTNDSFSPGMYVVMNEVSTVAAAYAMAGFATDAVHVSSSGTALAQTGITNAFANAANLETLGTGVALATTPIVNGVGGNGTVPQTEINTLANILAACMNSSGAGSSACTTLLLNPVTGISAQDTATAAINMAHNPGTNVAALYALSTATPPFAPALTGQPNDFTIVLNFIGGGLYYPGTIAIDGAGNAWVTNNNSISKLSPTGVALSPSTGYTVGGINYPNEIAIDGSGDAWTANSNNSVSELSNLGVAISPPVG